MVWIWAVVFIATVVFEITTVELISIWFALGSLIAFILALCGAGTTTQIIVFAIISVLMFIFFRPICMKFLLKGDEPTNVDSLVGSVHELLKEVNSKELGEIKINGVIWRVVSKNSETIEVGSNVKIIEVQGNKFVVEKGE